MSASKKNVPVQGEKLTYWRSIENRRRTEEYIASIENEFASDLTDITAIDRRSMLKVMGATVALAGLGVSCRRPEEKILPYVKQPEDIVPGVPNFFATAQPTPFGANGILVESHEGRPTKIEGNPSHPDSLGKASLVNQAAVLEVYCPDRSRMCTEQEAGKPIPREWAEWDKFAAQHFHELKKSEGNGLAVLCDADLSPTFLRLKDAVKKAMPRSQFYVHEPMREHNVEAAAALAFGANTRVRYHFDQAKIITTFFCDPFSFGPEHLRHMRGYAKNREVLNTDQARSMNRLYAVEADFSLGGTNSDHRLRLSMGLAPAFLRALAYELRATFNLDIDPSFPGAKTLAGLIEKPPSMKGIDRRFLLVMAKDLAMHKGQALIVGGDQLPKEALALIHVINVVLRGYDKTFEVVSIDDANAIAHLAEPGIDELAKALGENKVQSLFILGRNPAYDAPRHLKFASLIKNANVSVHHGQSMNETGALCTWHVPETHFLEHFGDARAYDGSISIIQPLIKPLHGARSTLELMAQMAGLEKVSTLDLVKETHRDRIGAADFTKSFNRAIHDGIIAGSGFKKASPQMSAQEIYSGFDALKSRTPSKENLELVVSFDRRVLDGRLSNHGWMQELPDPVTKLNWGNALLMSPTAAREFKIESGVQKNAYVADVVRVTVGSVGLELPVFVVPGLADHTVVTWLGYGRTRAGEVGNGIGYDVVDIIKDYNNRVFHEVKLERLSRTVQLSSTQEQFAMNGDTVQHTDVLSLRSRDPARMMKVADYVKNPTSAQNVGLLDNLLVKEPGKKEKQPLQVTDAWDYTTGNQWGMVIDLAKCTGCNACVVACQSENNIPVVGREQVIRGRTMQWLRVDRYFVGDVKEPLAVSQPVPCQHCENAPCEPVCPVAATTHDKEGLNAMAYNRCVGTRYCANNCPYKVRRFNYFDFTHTGNMHVEEAIAKRQKTLKLQRNPDVTVRYRGVMEKCTYCTQRIQEAKAVARRAGSDPNSLPDGAVTPACAQTCPSEAIVFGNINDENARVAKLKSIDRNYTMLDVLNARPRTSYLTMLRNPHPDLVV